MDQIFNPALLDSWLIYLENPLIYPIYLPHMTASQACTLLCMYTNTKWHYIFSKCLHSVWKWSAWFSAPKALYTHTHTHMQSIQRQCVKSEVGEFCTCLLIKDTEIQNLISLQLFNSCNILLLLLISCNSIFISFKRLQKSSWE